MEFKECHPENGRFVKLDYLSSYINDGKLDIPRLINDDFFIAIKLLWNNKLYISCSKLLLIFVDAISFVAYSDSSPQNFQRWLDTYVDMSSVGITSEQLWEHRNAILHFTSLESRKIKQGKVKRCMAYVGSAKYMPEPPPDEVWYDLHLLLNTIINGLENFLREFLPGNIETFVRNYDQICSDKRMLIAQVHE